MFAYKVSVALFQFRQIHQNQPSQAKVFRVVCYWFGSSTPGTQAYRLLNIVEDPKVGLRCYSCWVAVGVNKWRLKTAVDT